MTPLTVEELTKQNAMLFRAFQRSKRECDQLRDQLAAALEKLTALGHPVALYHPPPFDQAVTPGQGSGEPEVTK
jgi:hypothetical protein